MMKNKIIFITGAASGIGKASAILFAQQKPKAIVIADIEEEKLQQTAAEIEGYGVEVLSLAMDVGNHKSIDAVFKTIKDRYEKIDILVNSAGICRETPFNEITVEEWNSLMDINLLGTFLCCQKAIKMMIDNKIKGAIVNISSIAAKVGGLAAGAHYSASKAGVSCLTISAARYAGQFGIRVNAVAPGPIDNQMTKGWKEDVKKRLCTNTPLGCFGQSEQVAEAILFLASEKADYIMGEILDVNGGAYMD